MNPLIIVAVAGVVWFASRKKPKRQAIAGPRIPPIEPPIPRPIGEGGAEGEAGPDPTAWDGLAFDVEIYPAGATYRDKVAPPSSAYGISWSKGCDVVVVGDSWWDRVGDYIDPALSVGIKSASELAKIVIEREGLRGCPNGAGFRELRSEIFARIGEVLANEPGAGDELPLSQAIPGAILGATLIQPQFPMGPADSLHKRWKPGKGEHTIALLHKSTSSPATGQTVFYVQWYAWKPGVQLELGKAFAHGSKPTEQEALAAAYSKVDNYVEAKAVSNPLRRLVFW